MEDNSVVAPMPEVVIELIEKCEIVDEEKVPTEVNENKENAEVTNVSYEENCYYGNAKTYWSRVEPTVDGMLGGYGTISLIDVQASNHFLKHLFKMKPAPGSSLALDCGAGIGRVSKNLLMSFFDAVDLVEQDESFASKAEATLRPTGKLGEVFNVGLQQFKPTKMYDVIWVQWVLGHLRDESGHLLEFFQMCSECLNKNGILVVKENFSNKDIVILDTQDSSVTRPLSAVKKVFKLANLRIIKEQKQTNFPKFLYPVHMIALKPNKSK